MAGIEAFDGDTVRLKENNLRIRFEDTSDPASAPAHDWRLTANAASNGGPGRFAIDDVDGDALAGIAGADVMIDTIATTSVQLGDLDGDALFDVVAGNAAQTNRLYLNNGTAAPFGGVTGSDISADSDTTTAIAPGSLQPEGDVRTDARLPQRRRFHVHDRRQAEAPDGDPLGHAARRRVPRRALGRTS